MEKIVDTFSNRLTHALQIRNIKPIVPAINDAIRIAIFELFMISILSKASRVIKIDIVKPIPPKKPAPIILFHFKSVGNAQSPKPTPINEKSQIPKGFPITSPTIIPKLLVCTKPLCQLSPIAIQVLAIANNGRIKKATGLCKKCCRI